MFTGLIEEIGTVASIDRTGGFARIKINAPLITVGIKTGDSVAVDGVCFTVINHAYGWFWADIMPETIRKTTFKTYCRGARVNLERAVAAGERMGGHIVSGHVDGTGRIEGIKKEGNSIWFEISVKSEILKYLISEGSVAVDGTSLTIAGVSKKSFFVSIIPHTFALTIMRYKKNGDLVNIECDNIAKTICCLKEREKIYATSGKIDIDFLSKHGFI